MKEAVISLVLRITDLIRISPRWWMDALFTVEHVLYQRPSRYFWVDFSHSRSTVGAHRSPGLCWTPLQITLLSFCPFCKASKFADQTHSYMHPMIFCDLLCFFFMWIFKLSEICHLPAKLHHVIELSRDQPCTELSCQRTHVEFEMGRAHTAWVALERINSLLGVTATILQSAQSVCLTQIRLSGEPRLPTVRTPGFHSL